MGRPRKAGLDFYPKSTGFCSDINTITIRTKFGNDGVQTYECILEQIYGGGGYYLEYNEDTLCAIASIVQVKLNTVRQVIAHLCSRSLLVKITSKLTPSVTVITGADIQRQYQEAVKGRAAKTPVKVDEEFWILDEEETADFIKVLPSLSFSEKNPSYSEKNPSNSEKKCIKEKKRKNIDIEREASPAELRYLDNDGVNALFGKYLAARRKDGSCLSDDQINGLIQKLGSISEDPEQQSEVIREAIIHGWKSFFPVRKEDAKTRRREPGRTGTNNKKSGFFACEEREYSQKDYDELEKKLLALGPGTRKDGQT